MGTARREGLTWGKDLMDYEERCQEATTAQGLDPVVERLTAEAIPFIVEQTGGMCMAVTAKRDGYIFLVTDEGDVDYNDEVDGDGSSITLYTVGAYRAIDEDDTEQIDAELVRLEQVAEWIRTFASAREGS